MRGRTRKLLLGAGGAGAAAGGILLQKLFFSADRHAQRTEVHVASVKAGNGVRPARPLPSRREMLSRLRREPLDVLVVGGGATGAGCALDAASRGLRTGLVEADDFASGTSSRSTKLIHGGVRYLQKAIMSLDYEQYSMVKEALHERANLLDIAPHLSFPLPIMLPVYQWWKLPYYWAGIKAYDLVSGRECLKPSYYLNKDRALEVFPMLKSDKLKGAIVYYDGSHNDSRMRLSIAITAARYGAAIANHTRVMGLLKDQNGKVCGANVRNELTGEEFPIQAKCVINATGPFVDSIRKMDNPEVKEIVCPSAGVHVILPDYYSPSKMGLLDPNTSDGRVIFLFPWQGFTIAGTTDSPCEVTHSPAPSEKDIQFILGEVKRYLTPDIQVRRGDVQSAWAGIRPLVRDPDKEDTQSLVRNHVVHLSKPGRLVTIAGGKWTTYRAMAVETLDRAVRELELPAKRQSQTDGLLLEGGHGWTPTMFIRLVQDFGVDSEVARHLAETYGDRAFDVAELASLTGKRFPAKGRRLHEDFPYIEAEVRYACQEYAGTAVDVMARRLRLGFLNSQAAEESLPRVVEIMGQELGWSGRESRKQLEDAITFLQVEMGKDMNRQQTRTEAEVTLGKADVEKYVRRFNQLDKNRTGVVPVSDIRKHLEEEGEHEESHHLGVLVQDLQLATSGMANIDEFLKLMSTVKAGSSVRGSTYGQRMERSGGGV